MMAPNLIGSTFLLAETAIVNGDTDGSSRANNVHNKSNSGAKSPAATNTTSNNIDKTSNSSTASISKTYPVASISTNSSNSITSINKDRVSGQNEPDAISHKKSTLNVQENMATKQAKPYKVEIVWRNVILFIVLHSMALYGLALIFIDNGYMVFFCSLISAVFGAFGITAGVHRLWSHRAYKARLPLRIFLMLCQTFAFQNSIYEWSRDHRVHHKFTDTDADPHNSRRGFFFSHMGWLMCKKHPDVKEKGRAIDMSDLEADPVVMFQKKYYIPMMLTCCFVIPTFFPHYYFGVSLRKSFYIAAILRYTLSLHGTWTVNSVAHFYGMKPYDVTISSVNSKFVAAVAVGEGWHNYHHVFPWDYKAAELGAYKYNWTTAFLHFMAKIGQAYDLKSASDEMILKRVRRTGDGSHPSMADANNNSTKITAEVIAQLDHNNEETLVWGWDDQDVAEFDRSWVNITEKKEE